jgi:hypothetical protein
VKALRHRAAIALASAAALVAASAQITETAQASSRACGSGTSGSPGYAYAGHQSQDKAFGVRATITALKAPQVAAGHAAGWIGVGGPGQGPNGETLWLQVGLAAMPNTPPMIYAEITAPPKGPTFVPLLENVGVGDSHTVAVLEIQGRPDWWRVWLDGKPATDPINLAGSHGLWRPIVTAEAYDNQQSVCNGFHFRFEGVAVARRAGGSWRPFVPGYNFLDRGYAVRQLRPVTGSATRTLSADSLDAYAFDAVSS